MTLLNREGYCVKDPVTSDLSSIQKMAKLLEDKMLNMKDKKKQYVFTKIVRESNGDETLVTENDRQILSFGNGEIIGGDSSVISDCFKADCFIARILYSFFRKLLMNLTVIYGI